MGRWFRNDRSPPTNGRAGRGRTERGLRAATVGSRVQPEHGIHEQRALRGKPASSLDRWENEGGAVETSPLLAPASEGWGSEAAMSHLESFEE